MLENYTFVCDDASKIPVGPGKGSSVLCLSEEMGSVKRDILAMQHTMAAMRGELMRLQRFPSQPPLTRPMPNQSRGSSCYEAPLESSQTSVEGVVLRATSSGTSTDESRIRTQSDLSTANNPEDQGDDDGFVLQSSSKRKRRKAGKLGTASGSTLTSGPNKIRIQLTNVSPEINENDLKQYVSVQEGEVTVNNIEDMTGEGWDTKRFVLTFPLQHENKIMDPNFWPEGIYFSKWYATRRKRSDNQQATMDTTEPRNGGAHP